MLIAKWVLQHRPPDAECGLNSPASGASFRDAAFLHGDTARQPEDVPRLVRIPASVRENRLSDPASIGAADYGRYIDDGCCWSGREAAGSMASPPGRRGRSVWALFVAPEAEGLAPAARCWNGQVVAHSRRGFGPIDLGEAKQGVAAAAIAAVEQREERRLRPTIPACPLAGTCPGAMWAAANAPTAASPRPMASIASLSLLAAGEAAISASVGGGPAGGTCIWAAPPPLIARANAAAPAIIVGLIAATLIHSLH
jgi:hypothetical protein